MNKLGIWIGAGVFAFILLLIFSPLVIIDTSERGVVVNFGQVKETLSPGPHLVNPFTTHVERINVQTQAHKVSASAASADLQTASTEVTVNYHLNSDSVGTLWSTLGTDYISKVMDPSAQEAVKASTARYTANDLVVKRELVKDDILKLLREGVDRKAAGLITIADISITNFEFSKSFQQAIEQKVQAEQDALTQKNKLAQVQYEAQQTIATAEAESRAIKLKSDAANNEKYVALQQIEVQLEAAKHWNGEGCTNNCYGGTLPLPIPFMQVAK